jgi:aquaporin related protein
MAAMQSPGMSFDGVIHGGDDENNPAVNNAMTSDGTVRRLGRGASYVA